MQKILFLILTIGVISSIVLSSYITIQVKLGNQPTYLLFLGSFIAWLFYIFSWHYCIKNFEIKTAILSVVFGLIIEVIYFFSFLLFGDSLTIKQVIGIILAFTALLLLK